MRYSPKALTTARERLASAGTATVERAHDLRAELAVTERRAFEASHAMTLEAIRLRRASRPRVSMPVDAGPVGPLVAYREPDPPAGRMGPAAPLAWHKLRGLLVLASLALCLLAPSPAWAQRTPLSERAIAAALAGAHRDVFGEAPSAERLLVARAQVGLEVGRGRWAYCHNLGNIGAKRSRKVPSCVTKGGFRVRAYASPRAAARAYWRLRAVRRALPWFDRGDAHGAALALGRAGYYTAPREVYAARMAAVHRELSRDVVEGGR